MPIRVRSLPSFLAKKEVFEWLKQGKKTVDVRKGGPQRGDVAVFVSGPHRLSMNITAIESGKLTDVVREDNFKRVIPSAQSLGDALAYFGRLYSDCNGVFTAYTVVC